MWEAEIVVGSDSFDILYQEHRCGRAITQHYHLREPRHADEFENACWLTVQHETENHRRLDHRSSNRGIFQHHQRSLYLLSESSECSLAVRGLLVCLVAPEEMYRCSEG